MSKSNFSDDFKRDAVRQIMERGYPVSEVSQRLGVSQHSLYAWKKSDLPPLRPSFNSRVCGVVIGSLVGLLGQGSVW
ncbi:transposase, partial [Martelella mediterranea]